MSKTLVIAEKPSVAQDIVRALTPIAGKFDKYDDYFESEHYVVTSAVGHLVEIQAPEEVDVKRGKGSVAHLPVIPPRFDLKPVDKTKSRLAAVVKQAKRKDVTQLINACDAGREGELIFRLIEQYAGGAKGGLGKPIQRLWLQSMTPQAIRDGFNNLRSDAQMQGLADAARSRSEADWLVGINGTRAMTAFNSRDGGFFLTTVGRVQTPTLSLIVSREEKIRAFQSREYFEVHANFAAQAGQYAGKWFDPQFKKTDDPEAKADRLWKAEDAQAIAAAVRGNAATVTEESKPSTQASPLLFDLTSLQREANGKFGFSAKTTLALAQALYEKHKALTYPRTDSRALPEDYVPVARQTFEMLANSPMAHLAPYAQQALQHNYLRPTKRVFDNSQVSDHFAIIPTTQAPSGLSEAEQKLYDLVVRRFMAVFFPAAQYQITTRISQVAQHHFKTEGKVLIHPGWLAIYGKEAASETDGGKDGDKGQPLVAVQPGEHPRVALAQAKPLHTKPPARYSEATLLGAMESAGKQVEDEELRSAMQEKGLGTPATRAAIIEGLLSEKYLLREGRELLPTAKAFQLMTLLRGLEVQELCKPELTGEWEYKLAQMERGELSRAAFMQEIAAATPAPAPTARAKAAAFRSPNRPLGAPLKWPRPKPCCANAALARWRAFAPRPAGPSPPKWPSCWTRPRATTSSNLILATTKRARSRASWWTSAAKPAWVPAPPVARRSMSTAATTCAAKRCPPRSKLCPAARSKAGRSSCSNRLSVRRCKNCWPPARPMCWESSSPTARAAPSKRTWCGMPARAKSASILNSATANTRHAKLPLPKQKLAALARQALQKQKQPKPPPAKREQLAKLQPPTTAPMPPWPP